MNWLLVLAVWTTEDNIDYPGNDMLSNPKFLTCAFKDSTSCFTSCAQSCMNQPGCVVFTMNKKNFYCYLKTSTGGGKLSASYAMSGVIQRSE